MKVSIFGDGTHQSGSVSKMFVIWDNFHREQVEDLPYSFFRHAISTEFTNHFR